MLGYKHSPESLEKMRITHLGKIPWNKGRKLSLKHRALLKLHHRGMSGKKLTLKHKELIRKRRTGTKLSAETRKKISEVQKGKIISLETRKKMSLAHRGSKAWNWKGGQAGPQSLRYTYLYQEWRKAVFERDNYTCQMCEERGGKLEANHIKLFSKFPELRLDVTNGITLCKPCHKKIRRIEHWYEWFFFQTLKTNDFFKKYELIYTK